MILSQLLLSLSIVANLLSIVIVVTVVLPRLIIEVKVRDGLALIRRGFLAIVIFYLITTILSFLSFLINPQDVNDIVKIIRSSVYFNTLSLFNALGRLSIVILLAVIYRWRFKEPYL